MAGRGDGGEPGAAAVDPPETPRRLVEAAAEIFAEQGYEGARVQEIARRAGLTTGAIYGRFEGKADLFAATLKAQSGPAVEGILASLVAETPPNEVLRLLAGFLVTGPPLPTNSLVLDAVAAARRDPALAVVIRRHIEDRGKRLGEILERARAEGALAPEVAIPALVRLCLTLIFGTVTLKTLGFGPPDSAEWNHLMSRLVEALAKDA